MHTSKCGGLVLVRELESIAGYKCLDFLNQKQVMFTFLTCTKSYLVL